MHPEIKQEKPGKCPKCGGMNLAKNSRPQSSDHCATTSHPLTLSRNLKLASLAFLLIFAVSFIPHPFLKPLNTSLISYLNQIWWAILLGFLIGGLIDYFVPDNFIFKHLGSHRPRSLLSAVIAGFFMSACSHGILALSIQLYKKGASIPSVITFLLASPWANLPVTILLFSFFGLKALLIITAAMIIALITGTIFIFLEKHSLIESSRPAPKSTAVDWQNLKHFQPAPAHKGVFFGALGLANMVLWWIIIGFLIAAAIQAYVPGHYFMRFFGPGILGLILTLAFATIIEVCSEGSAPIAFEIYKQVGTIGNPFVFLMAGVITDFTEIGLIWTNIGRKSALWLPLVTIPQVLLVAWLFNTFL